MGILPKSVSEHGPRPSPQSYILDINYSPYIVSGDMESYNGRFL